MLVEVAAVHGRYGKAGRGDVAFDRGAVEGTVGITAVAVKGNRQRRSGAGRAPGGGPGQPPAHLVAGPEPAGEGAFGTVHPRRGARGAARGGHGRLSAPAKTVRRVIAVFIGLLGCKPGRCGPGGNPCGRRWPAVPSILPGDNQARRPLPVLNRRRGCRGSADRTGSLGPLCEARTWARCLRVAVAILVVHGREDVNVATVLIAASRPAATAPAQACEPADFRSARCAPGLALGWPPASCAFWCSMCSTAW